MSISGRMCTGNSEENRVNTNGIEQLVVRRQVNRAVLRTKLLTGKWNCTFYTLFGFIV